MKKSNKALNQTQRFAKTTAKILNRHVVRVTPSGVLSKRDAANNEIIAELAEDFSLVFMSAIPKFKSKNFRESCGINDARLVPKSKKKNITPINQEEKTA